MKNLFKIAFGALCAIIPTAGFSAVCPVCVVGVGAGLAFADALGVDYSIIGLWSGGLMLALTFWTAGWLKKRGVDNIWLYLVLPFVLYYGMLYSVYAFPDVIVYGAQSMFGIDKLLLGSIIGTIVFYFGERHYSKISKANGGKSQYPFQKVLLPIEYLAVSNIALWLLIRYVF